MEDVYSEKDLYDNVPGIQNFSDLLNLRSF